MKKLHAPLLPLAVCLMTGIAAADWLPDWTVGVAVLAVCVVCAFLLNRRPRWQTAGIWLCCVVLGMTLGARKQRSMDVGWPEQPVSIDVVVVAEPVVKERAVVLDVLTATGHQLLRLRLPRTADSERVEIGQGLRVTANINKVHEWQSGHFSYRCYMQCHGFSGEAFVGNGQWQGRAVPLAGLSLTERARLRFLCWRHSLLERYRQWDIGDDVYGILAAMTLGEKSQLDAGLKDTYSRVGAAHVLALSGLHLMIIYSVVTLFLGWRRFRTLTQVLTVLAVWAFAFLVGLSPSVVRSATMISVYGLLSLGYRERMSVNTLAFVAMAMLVVNPLSLYDIGFQLSFMAVLAILLLNPLFQRVVPLHVQQRHRWLGALWGLTTVSISAQAGTAPLVAYYFGRFSTWFLLSNYIVVPLATVVLYLTLACVLTFWWVGLQQLLVTVLSAVVLVMNRLLEAVAGLPLCSIDGISLTALQLLCVYVLLACGYVLVSLRCRAADRNG